MLKISYFSIKLEFSFLNLLQTIKTSDDTNQLLSPVIGEGLSNNNTKLFSLYCLPIKCNEINM